jgi:hypothetical protein
MIAAAEHVYQCLPVLLVLPYQAPSFYHLLLPTIQSVTPPDAVLGHELSLFASALDAQNGMSVSSTEVENQFNDFLEDDRKSSVAQDNDADVHNNTATIGDTVPAYRFMPWLYADDPDAFAMEDLFFLRGEVDLSNDEEEVDEFHPNHVIVAPHIISSSPPFLFLDMHQFAKIQYHNTFTTTKQRSSRTSRWMLPRMTRSRSSCIILLKIQLSSKAFDDVHEWAKKWLKLGYKLESAKAKTVMNRMMSQYEPFTAPPHLRPSTEALVITYLPRQSATGI